MLATFKVLVLLVSATKTCKCAEYFNHTTAAVLCDMVASFPRLKRLASPWSCPNESATESIAWCQNGWTGLKCNVRKTLINSFTLANQALVGSIPSSIGLLTSLKSYLWLNNNRLYGSIPPSIGNLSLISSIRLDHNFLTGTVPRSLLKLNKLITLNLNDNYLSGSLPILYQRTFNDDGGNSTSSFDQFTHLPTSQPSGQPSRQPTSQPCKYRTSLFDFDVKRSL